MKGHARPLGAALRALVRQKAGKVEEQSRCICHRQKALTQMNVQLDAVVSDPMAKSGSTVLRAIVARPLHGHWRPEHFFRHSHATIFSPSRSPPATGR